MLRYRYYRGGVNKNLFLNEVFIPPRQLRERGVGVIKEHLTERGTNLLLLPSMVGLIVMMVSPFAFRITLASLLSPTATASCSWRSLVVMARSKTIL